MFSSSFNQSRTAFCTQWVVVTILSLWRIVTCLWEYDHAPFVSVFRALLDQTPFWSLAGLVVAYSGWKQATPRSIGFLLLSTSILVIAAGDIVIVNGTARQSLHTLSWAGHAYISSVGDEPWQKDPTINVTFTRDGHVFFYMGPNRVPVYQGEWHMKFDAMRLSPAMTLSGFGRANYWNRDDLHVDGSFKVGDRSYRISAQLKQVPKRPG